MKTLRLKGTAGYIYLKCNDIIMIEGDANYSKIYTKDKKFFSAKTLKKYELLLCEAQFLRVHKSHLINAKYIIKKTYESNMLELTMSNGKIIPVSRRNLKKISISDC